jgi:hypothetical protein
MNVPFGSKFGCKVDIYLPYPKKYRVVNASLRHPVIVFFYGGSLYVNLS